MKPVFISYSAKEAQEAESIRNFLETNGVPCWIAPRDIPGGSHYAREIPSAIRACKVFVLMLSRNAQDSIWVSRELDQAVNGRKVILPLMLEDFTLNDEFNFYLTGAQRLLFYRQKAEVMLELIQRIRAIVGTNTDTETVPGIFPIPTIGMTSSPLRFDGLYVHTEKGASSYLRFYEDGTVVSVFSTGTPQQVIRWFGHDYSCRGTYTFTGASIHFETADTGCPSIEYSGTVGCDSLSLDIHSNITGNRSHCNFNFIPMP